MNRHYSEKKNHDAVIAAKNYFIEMEEFPQSDWELKKIIRETKKADVAMATAMIAVVSAGTLTECYDGTWEFSLPATKFALLEMEYARKVVRGRRKLEIYMYRYGKENGRYESIGRCC